MISYSFSSYCRHLLRRHGVSIKSIEGKKLIVEAKNAEIITHNAESISIHIESPLEEQIDSDNYNDSSISSEIHTFIEENITPPCEEYLFNINESLESTIQLSLNYGESTISTPIPQLLIVRTWKLLHIIRLHWVKLSHLITQGVARNI